MTIIIVYIWSSRRRTIAHTEYNMILLILYRYVPVTATDRVAYIVYTTAAATSAALIMYLYYIMYMRTDR